MKDGRFLSSVSFVSVVDAMISLRCSSKALEIYRHGYVWDHLGILNGPGHLV